MIQSNLSLCESHLPLLRTSGAALILQQAHQNLLGHNHVVLFQELQDLLSSWLPQTPPRKLLDPVYQLDVIVGCNLWRPQFLHERGKNILFFPPSAIGTSKDALLPWLPCLKASCLPLLIHAAAIGRNNPKP